MGIENRLDELELQIDTLQSMIDDLQTTPLEPYRVNRKKVRVWLVNAELVGKFKEEISAINDPEFIDIVWGDTLSILEA